MLCYLIRKTITGHDPNAVMMGLQWLLRQSAMDLYIYTETKDHAGTFLPDYDPFGALKKDNSVTVNGVTLRLFFGNGPGVRNGDVPKSGTNSPVLILLGKPERLGWVMERFANACACLVPWSPDEGDEWQKANGAASI